MGEFISVKIKYRHDLPRYGSIIDNSLMIDPIEEIWANNIGGKGQCNDCPNWDPNHYWTPYFGGGSKDAKIAFIAITPGEKRHKQVSDKAREPADNHAEQMSWNTNSSANMFSRFLRPVVEAIPRLNSKTEIALNKEIYYTNGKKCPDIEPTNDDLFRSKSAYAKYKNAKAYQHCHQYLRKEIDFVNPEVIVTVGKKPWKALCGSFSAQDCPEFSNEIILERYMLGKYTVIPSYHWNRLGTNFKHLDAPIKSENQYLQYLAAEIDSTLRLKNR